MADGRGQAGSALEANEASSEQTAAWLHTARLHAANLYAAPDLIVTSGQGAWLSTADGRRLLDFAGGMGVSLLGHGHPQILAALKAQAGLLLHTSNALLTPAPIELARELARISDGCQSFFVNSGAEAIEGALKLARLHAHRRGQARRVFVACERGFHGRTLGALSVTGQPTLQAGFHPLLEEIRFVPYDDLERAAAAMNDQVAAFVVEPIQGNGGVRVPRAGYLQGLAKLCRQHGALLIADEVQTGMGRTGAWLASHAAGIRPDIICLAKALGGGLPLGAVLAPRDVMAALRTGNHGSTFGGNPLAAAAALAVIATVEADGLLARAEALGARAKQAAHKLPNIGEVRGQGLLWGLELTGGDGALDAQAVRTACLQHDLLVTVAGKHVVRLFLPATLQDDELRLGMARLESALRSLSS